MIGDPDANLVSVLNFFLAEKPEHFPASDTKESKKKPPELRRTLSKKSSSEKLTAKEKHAPKPASSKIGIKKSSINTIGKQPSFESSTNKNDPKETSKTKSQTRPTQSRTNSTKSGKVIRKTPSEKNVLVSGAAAAQEEEEDSPGRAAKQAGFVTPVRASPHCIVLRSGIEGRPQSILGFIRNPQLNLIILYFPRTRILRVWLLIKWNAALIIFEICVVENETRNLTSHYGQVGCEDHHDSAAAPWTEQEAVQRLQRGGRGGRGGAGADQRAGGKAGWVSRIRVG